MSEFPALISIFEMALDGSIFILFIFSISIEYIIWLLFWAAQLSSPEYPATILVIHELLSHNYYIIIFATGPIRKNVYHLLPGLSHIALHSYYLLTHIFKILKGQNHQIFMVNGRFIYKVHMSALHKFASYVIIFLGLTTELIINGGFFSIFGPCYVLLLIYFPPLWFCKNFAAST